MSKKHAEEVQEREPDSPDPEGDTPDSEEADAVIQAIDELADRAQEIEQLQEELSQAEDRIKRQAAEFQNYRRRTEQEKSQMVTFGKTLVVKQMLDVLDDFARSLDATEQAESEVEGDLSPAYQSLKSGVQLVFQKLTDELEKLGVEAIESVGKPFNEDEHEALMQQPAPEGTEPGTVISEIQKGYRMGERVLRHARVVVAN